MGSGAFLVEACRALGSRLVEAWSRHPEKRPVIPPDEDEDLHARRLVAQRCLYGVDKNPLATDLAKLSLWLATLARDHEFTFLDHALKSGDSLVGLNAAQIAAAHWDASKPGLPLFRQLVKERIAEARKGRAEIQAAPDDTARAIQEARHRSLEARLKDIRLIGDAVIGAFFAENKPKAREKKRAEVESWLGGSPVAWDKLTAMTATLKQGPHPLTPFHWEIEFPEAFTGQNGGFDAIVGNPPFLGGARLANEYGQVHFSWLTGQYVGCRHQCDLVAYFFRRAFQLLREGGCIGLIATKSISEGDTRAGSLQEICRQGGNIIRANRRFLWPGEAAVLVSMIYILKGASSSHSFLDGRGVTRISAYLVEGTFDASPYKLSGNPYFSLGLKIYGQGFLFDDADERASPLERLETIRSKNLDELAYVHPYVGGDELNSEPRLDPRRFVINLNEFQHEEDIPACELLAIIKQKVKPERDELSENSNTKPLKRRWWAYQAHRPALMRILKRRSRILVHSQISSHINFQFGSLVVHLQPESQRLRY